MNRGNFIFLLGHMRSRSSLLTHILLNNPKVYGLGESLKTYNSILDMWSMQVKIRMLNKSWLFDNIMLDQINHNARTPNLNLLEQNGEVIILIRRPSESLESIKLLMKEKYVGGAHKVPNERLFILDSERIISDTDNCLNELSEFLGLTTVFGISYAVYDWTWIKSDSSMYIEIGEIQVKERPIYETAISDTCYELYEDIIGWYSYLR